MISNQQNCHPLPLLTADIPPKLANHLKWVLVPPTKSVSFNRSLYFPIFMLKECWTPLSPSLATFRTSSCCRGITREMSRAASFPLAQKDWLKIDLHNSAEILSEASLWKILKSTEWVVSQNIKKYAESLLMMQNSSQFSVQLRSRSKFGVLMIKHNKALELDCWGSYHKKIAM